MEGRKEGKVLFNDALNTFYLVIWKEVFYLTMHKFNLQLLEWMEEWKGLFYLMMHIIFTVIWCQTYGKGPFR